MRSKQISRYFFFFGSILSNFCCFKHNGHLIKGDNYIIVWIVFNYIFLLHWFMIHVDNPRDIISMA